MSSDGSVDGADPATNGEGDDIERIVDPDNYNLRRRLKQLHDARERVRERKSKALSLEMRRRDFSAQRRDRLVAEAAVDYINELLPVVKRKGDAEDFGSKTVDLGRDGEVSVEEFAQSRGTTDDDGRVPYPYQVSMEIWNICNTYFEQIAGAEFEQQGLPAETGFDSTGEA